MEKDGRKFPCKALFSHKSLLWKKMHDWSVGGYRYFCTHEDQMANLCAPAIRELSPLRLCWTGPASHEFEFNESLSKSVRVA